ncbi:MAG: hypothetical protein GX813_04265 [Erysipelotrichia bacterium]|nr:hypothetical protein [Erysipelotrichia bacterium]
MSLLKSLMRQMEKIDFLFPNNFKELMENEYYDYDKFEWFLYYVFKLEGCKVEKVGKKGKGDGGADLIINIPQEAGGFQRIGIQAKYWKNKVGTQPINQLASARARLSLSDLWIITTSDLTSDAKEIAESMDIKILRGDDVAVLIESVKKRYNEDIDKNGESSIEFIKSTEVKITKQKKSKANKEDNIAIDKRDEELEKKLRALRVELSKKHNLYPTYNVFNNETLQLIASKKPITIEELSKIKGIGKKKIETFGNELIEFIKNNSTPYDKQLENAEEDLLQFLISERAKIAKYNNLSEEEVYSDKIAEYLAKMKPTDKKSLEKIYGFKKENIEIFGDYLTKIISRKIKH